MLDTPRGTVTVDDPCRWKGLSEATRKVGIPIFHIGFPVSRLWGAVKHFFAYPHLMDRPWESALEEFLPLAAAARSELEYHQVIARMGVRLHDSHVTWRLPSLPQWLYGGPARQSAVLRIVDGKLVVVRLIGNESDGAGGG